MLGTIVSALAHLILQQLYEVLVSPSREGGSRGLVTQLVRKQGYELRQSVLRDKRARSKHKNVAS